VSDVERYRDAMLGVAVGDPPWDTALAWGDAQMDLPGRSRQELDKIVLRALVDLLDRGLIFFYRSGSFDDDCRAIDETEALPRSVVVAALAKGSVVHADGAISVERLCFRATERGRTYYESLPPHGRTS
jgi:hypothetical protein